MANQNVFGLVGFPLTHSFSKQYFTNKFEKEGIKNTQYELFSLDHIEQFPSLMQQNPEIKGLNVTIPYKESIIEFLDDLDESARAVGAVNVIKVVDGKLIGYNSDVYGFEQSLLRFMAINPDQFHYYEAFVLGTGGASKAVTYILRKLGFPHFLVSRKESRDAYPYFVLNDIFIVSRKPKLIINTTPLGMYPAVESAPKLPYKMLTDKDLVFDLVYNPEETLLMQRAKAQGAKVQNGLEMLHLQAEKAWEIWNI
jgi:shikimate dehydrogenase